MPISTKAGRFTKYGTAVTAGNTADQLNAITGLGFQAKAIFFYSIGVSVYPTWEDTLRNSHGFSAGSTQNYSIGFASDHGATAANTSRRAQDGHCFCLGSAASSTGPMFKVKNFNADGSVDLTYNRNDANTWDIHYFAIGGTDITNIKAGAFTPSSGTAPYTQDINDVGFEPDIVFFMGAVTAPPTVALPSQPTLSVPHQVWFQGAAKSSSAQHVMAYGSVDAADPMASNRMQRTDACIGWLTPGTADTVDGRASYVGTITTGTSGFRIQWDDAPATRPTNSVLYLAIKGGSWNVGSHNQPTGVSAPTTTSVTGLNHTPKGLMIYGYEASAGTSVTGSIKYSMGAGNSSTSYWNVMGADLDGAATSATFRAHKDQDSVYTVPDPDLPVNAILGSADINSASAKSTEEGDTTSRAKLNSFQSGGFTLGWQNLAENTTARQWLYVTVGDNVTQAAIKQVSESVGITEPLSKRRSHAQTENVGITEAFAKGRARSILETEGVGEAEPVKIKTTPPPTTKIFQVPESVGVTESKSKKWGHAQNESVGITEQTRRIKNLFKLAPFDVSQTIERISALPGRIRRAPLEVIQDVESKYNFRGLLRKSPLEVVQKIESASRKVQFYEASITPSHMVLYFSGGANNTDNTLSIGGARSTYVASGPVGGAGGFKSTGFTDSGFTVTVGPQTNIWDVVLQSEASPGDTEYRCYYLRNNHTSLTASNIKLWINTNTQRGEIQIGLGASAVNGTETAIANENTAPGSVTFYTPTSETDPNVLTISSLAAGAHKAIWLKRVIPAATTAFLNTTYTLEMSFYTDFQQV